jgi:hypothetical protein
MGAAFGRHDPRYQRLYTGAAQSRARRAESGAQSGPEVVARQVARLVEGPVDAVHYTAPEQTDASSLLEAHKNLPWPEYARFTLERYMDDPDWWTLPADEPSASETGG